MILLYFSINKDYIIGLIHIFVGLILITFCLYLIKIFILLQKNIHNKEGNCNPEKYSKKENQVIGEIVDK